MKEIRLPQDWVGLVRRVEPAPCILLKGDGADFMFGWGFEAEIRFEQGQMRLEKLQEFLDQHQGNYILGYLGYDVKNVIENALTSKPDDKLNFPDAHFFVVKHLIEQKGGRSRYFGPDGVESVTAFFEQAPEAKNPTHHPVQLISKTSRERYLQQVEAIQKAIQFGTVYELNYCVQFYAENATLDPLSVFIQLNTLSQAPFSVYLHSGDHAVICASPERYLQKTGKRLISQPIKGTARRGKTDGEDRQIRDNLKTDPKERAENVMIVDLVRNDFSRIAEKNSVQVDELCGVYSFKTVHQLVSTVSCTLRSGIPFTEILRATFPMGSMTGAPKISAMQLAEEHEDFRRGLYSGTIGYIDPQGDFDFNVVIRSILYNRKTKVVSCGVGGAITINAEPEKEYEECLLKLDALQRALC